MYLVPFGFDRFQFLVEMDIVGSLESFRGRRGHDRGRLFGRLHLPLQDQGLVASLEQLSIEIGKLGLHRVFPLQLVEDERDDEDDDQDDGHDGEERDELGRECFDVRAVQRLVKPFWNLY